LAGALAHRWTVFESLVTWALYEMSDFYDEDDDFMGDYTGGNDMTMGQRDYDKVAYKIFNEGFIVGKSKGVELLRQVNFDDGFKKGISIGQACGQLYGHCRVILTLLVENDKQSKVESDGTNSQLRHYHSLVEHAEQLIFHDIPDGKREIESITMDVQRLATDIQVASNSLPPAAIPMGIDLLHDADNLRIALTTAREVVIV
jgi:hypothetical protein